MLRCGGNLVIPGTDKNSHIYRDLAADMGLRITHHHAEPLGAPMFARRYPELTPSYDEYPEKFHELWKEGIDEQKKLDVIWNLGFRGQETVRSGIMIQDTRHQSQGENDGQDHWTSKRLCPK